MQIKSGTIIKSKYEVLKNVGSGGTADIYLCKNLENDSRVALKVSKENAKVSSLSKRFKLEYESLSKFNNRNIVRVYDFFTWNDLHVIVMEYIEGNTLKSEIKNQRVIKPKVAVEYMIQILNGLKDVHKEKIYHRDLNPANIMLTTSNVIKIMDFGIVQVSVDQGLTKAGNVIGTIAFMAPELIRHEKANEKSEIYSIGIALYYMVTGTMPFSGGDLYEVAQKHLKDTAILPHKINSNVDIWLSKIIMKMLEKDAFERYQTAEEVSNVLTNYLNIKPNFTNDQIEYLLLLKPDEDDSKKIFGIFKRKK